MKYPHILTIAPEAGEFVYDDQRTMLYALAVGAGSIPEDLRFVYEKGLRALPTMVVLMAAGAGDFIRDGGVDFSRIVHGEQRTTLHRPLPPAGRMLSSAKCLGVVDKGPDKGALLNVANEIRDMQSGEHVATSVMTLFCRGDGGFGGPSSGDLPLHEVPDRSYDVAVTLPTSPQQAAWYRLLGDRNPLHIDPDLAKRVGFDRPILHGLCTYGIAGRAILQAYCDNDPAMIEQLDVRFASPVFPGESITTQIWRDGRTLSFECRVLGRDATVIRNGHCLLRQ